MEVHDSYDEYPYIRGNGLTAYMMGKSELRTFCENCKHFVESECLCIKYSPTFIVETKHLDTCDEWEKK